MGSSCLMGTEFQFRKEKDSGGGCESYSGDGVSCRTM